MHQTLLRVLPGILTKWTTVSCVTIVDPYLSILSWFFKFMVLIYLFVLLILNKQYLLVEEPGGYPVIWFEAGDLVKVQNEGTPYCEEGARASYDYLYPGAAGYWDDKDIACQDADFSEMTAKTAKDGFVVTFLKEEHKKKEVCGSGDACSQITGLAGARAATNTNVNSACTCGKLQDYFATGSEAILLYIQHTFATSAKMSYATGSSTDVATSGDSKTIKTCVRKMPLSDVCTSDELPENKWSTCCLREFAVGETMSMTVGDWVAAAGISLDSRAEGKLDTDRETGLYPYRRTAGLRLIFNMRYYGRVDQAETVRCEIEVGYADGWLSHGIDNVMVDVQGKISKEYYSTYRRGISFNFIASGKVKRFDFMLMVNALVSGVVFLGFVDTVVGLVAFNLHPRRSVFKKAKQVELDYNRIMGQFGAQIALACHAYKQWDQSGKTLADGGHQEGELCAQELSEVYKPYFDADEALKLSECVIREATVGQGDARSGVLKAKQMMDLLGSGLVSRKDLMANAEKLHGRALRLTLKEAAKVQDIEQDSPNAPQAWSA